MRKMMAAMFCLVIVFSLVGCGTTENRNVSTVADGADLPDDDTVLTIQSSGKTVSPFLHFVYDEEWDGDGFLCADGTPVEDDLTEWTEATHLPDLVYSGDFAVSYAERVSFRSVVAYDESMHQLEDMDDPEELSKLASGRYYIGIVVDQEGDYIEEAKQSEITGWVCLFRMAVEA